METSQVQETSQTQETRQFYDETSDTSSSSTLSLGERFAADSAQRYTATQNLLRIGRREKEQEIQEQEREVQKQQKEIQEQQKGQDQEAKETGCIVGKHKEVITACLQELEQSSYSSISMQELEAVNASSDLEQLERQYHPSSFPSPCPSSPGPPARSPSCSSCLTTEEDNTGKETDDEDTTMGDTTAKETDEDTDTEVDEDTHSVLGKRAVPGTVFLTECSTSPPPSPEEQDRGRGRKERRGGGEKRRRNRTIDYHDLPSTLFFECSVRDYHEKKYEEKEKKQEEKDESEKKDDSVVNNNRVEIAKDGLGLILQRLHNIESKLDDLKSIETTILGPDCPSTRRLSLPGRLGSLSPCKPLALALPSLGRREDRHREEMVTPGGDLEDCVSSLCSTPTVMEPRNRLKVNGYESDDTQVEDSDHDGVIDDRSEEENGAESSYRSFPIELNIEEMSEDEDPDARQKRIESLASSIEIPDIRKKEFQRPEMNMEIDTLSERSEEEGEREEVARPKVRSRRISGRKRSESRERNVAKIRYCWRCHHAGHENWQCQEDVQPGGWCPRCLESSHWEDACWVEAAHVLCPICSIPGHLPCVHQATDFRQRKLVIDTFGWLAFREWFQDMTFRSWWNCSGFTGVPLYKIMQRNPSQDLDLGFEEQ